MNRAIEALRAAADGLDNRSDVTPVEHEVLNRAAEIWRDEWLDEYDRIPKGDLELLRKSLIETAARTIATLLALDLQW